MFLICFVIFLPVLNWGDTQGDLKQNRTAEGRKRKNAGVVWGKSVFGESGLILERTVSSFWHRISPLLRRLVQRGVKERKGARKGLKRHRVECVCWHSHENCGTTIIWERVSTRLFLRPPEMGLFCSGSSTENFLRETGSMFIAQEPELLPLPPSWAGDLHVQTWRGMPGCSLLWPAGSAPPERLGEHLLRREARGIMLAWTLPSVSHHSQAASVGCSVSGNNEREVPVIKEKGVYQGSVCHDLYNVWD